MSQKLSTTINSFIYKNSEEIKLDQLQGSNFVTETGLKNPIISAMFILFGGTAVILLFLVLIIHMKYSKFRQNIYGVIFSCIICEFFFCIIYFIHGIDYLAFNFLEKSDKACDIFSFTGNFLIGTLITYNLYLIINLLLKKIPSLRYYYRESKRLKYENINNDFFKNHLDLRKFSFVRIHITSLFIGFFHAIYLFLTNNIGRLQTGTCIIKDKPNAFIIVVILAFCVFFISSLIYIINDKFLKKKYHEDFPILKKYSFYLFFTSFGWGLWLFGLWDINNDDIGNCISISGGLIVFFGISYYRISCGYVKSILNQESSSSLIAAIMIILCLDNRADPDLYDSKSTINIKTEEEEVIN
jgi:hypothetical protein